MKKAELAECTFAPKLDWSNRDGKQKDKAKTGPRRRKRKKVSAAPTDSIRRRIGVHEYLYRQAKVRAVIEWGEGKGCPSCFSGQLTSCLVHPQHTHARTHAHTQLIASPAPLPPAFRAAALQLKAPIIIISRLWL